jgi:hypothetical protein
MAERLADLIRALKDKARSVIGDSNKDPEAEWLDTVRSLATSSLDDQIQQRIDQLTGEKEKKDSSER